MNPISIKSICLSLGLMLVAILSYLAAMACLFINSDGEVGANLTCYLFVFMPIGFIVIPQWLLRKKFPFKRESVEKFFSHYIFMALLVFLVNHFLLHRQEFWLAMVVSLCEEVLFRSTIYTILREDYSKPVSILLTSILFAFILHLNYPLLDNLFFRLPLGFLLQILALRCGLPSAIAAHWLYNLVVSI